jgi:hypothetical protein
MSGKLTLWGAGEFLNTFFSQTAAPPTSFYMALITDIAPTPYLSGAELSEPDADDYQRLEIPNVLENWSNAGQIQVMVLNVDLAFPAATSDWGTVSWWALCNAQADGYPYAIGNFDSPDSVLTGDVVQISAGNIAISLGPFFTEDVNG